MRRLSFHDSSGGQHHEEKIMPSITALQQHICRAQYVVRLAYESPSHTSSFADCHDCGWLFRENDVLSVVWDTAHGAKTASMVEMNYHCSCRTGCVGGRGGCQSCFQNCQPCTVRCRCRGNCQNPHNRNGVSTRCRARVHDRISVLVWANETLITRPSYSNQDPQLLDVVDADDKSSSKTGTDCEDEEVKIEGDFTGQPNRLPVVFPSYSHLAHSVSDLYHEGSSTEED